MVKEVLNNIKAVAGALEYRVKDIEVLGGRGC